MRVEPFFALRSSATVGVRERAHLVMFVLTGMDAQRVAFCSQGYRARGRNPRGAWKRATIWRAAHMNGQRAKAKNVCIGIIAGCAGIVALASSSSAQAEVVNLGKGRFIAPKAAE